MVFIGRSGKNYIAVGDIVLLILNNGYVFSLGKYGALKPAIAVSFLEGTLINCPDQVKLPAATIKFFPEKSGFKNQSLYFKRLVLESAVNKH